MRKETVGRRTHRAKRHIKKSPLYDPIRYTGKNDIATSVRHIVYDNEQCKIVAVTQDVDLLTIVEPQKRNWFKLVGFSSVDQILAICKHFGLHRFDVQDLVTNEQIVKIEEYRDATLILLSDLYFREDGGMEIDRVAFILTKDALFTFQENDTPIFDDVTDALQNSLIQIRERSEDFLLSILLDRVLNRFDDVILKIDTRLDAMEDGILNMGAQDVLIADLHDIRSQYMVVKRIIIPFREDLRGKLQNSNKLVDQQNLYYFESLQIHLRNISQNIEMCHESIASVVEIYYNNNSYKMNQTIKRLTVVSTIFIPLTFLVGVWGMNFRFMPEIEWPFGYLLAWIIMVIVGLGSWWLLRKKDWY